MKHRKLLFALIAVLSPLIRSNAQFFTRVNSVNELKAGDQVVIGQWDNDSYFFVGDKSNDSGNRRFTVKITVQNDTIMDIKTATVFQLGGETDKWTFWDLTNNEYLGVKISSTTLSNYLLPIKEAEIKMIILAGK